LLIFVCADAVSICSEFLLTATQEARFYLAVKCIEQTFNFSDSLVHSYKWISPAKKPERILLLIHGLLMHGKAFDHFATYLAARDCAVVAPDLRGFGRSHFSSNQGELSKIDYQKSFEDLCNVMSVLKKEYPNIPLFCAGESLGTHLARHLAHTNPEDIDGLVLSSPCLRPKMISAPLIPHALMQLVQSRLDPNAEFNLRPFAERFLRDEPVSLDSYLNDPMTRKSLEILELIDSIRIVGSLEFQQISGHIPILVLRGKKDCVCESTSMTKFLDALKTDNLTVHPCKGCGHLILQNPDVDGSVLDTIYRWLRSSISSTT
jgi:alpha-beta hydrolase superfamily lysophospholipase